MPQLVITKGPEQGRVLKLSRHDSPVIGRKGSPVVIDDPHISREHVRFYMKDNRWYVEDLGSSNGTYVNRQRISEPVKLREGDKINIGQTQLMVRAAKKKQKPKRPPMPGVPGGVRLESDRKSLDASSILLNVLDDLETFPEDIGEYVPDFDPDDHNAWLERQKKRLERPDDDKTVTPDDPTAPL